MPAELPVDPEPEPEVEPPVAPEEPAALELPDVGPLDIVLAVPVAAPSLAMPALAPSLGIVVVSAPASASALSEATTPSEFVFSLQAARASVIPVRQRKTGIVRMRCPFSCK
jgi:hypothetical protein